MARPLCFIMRFYAICLIMAMAASACGRGQDSGAGEMPTATKSPSEVGRAAPAEAAAVDPWQADSIAYLRWGSPASPYRDEGRYIRFLDSLLAIDSLPEGLREQAQHRRRIAMLNRPGSVAADFRYVDRNGKESRLHELKSPQTLLIFYDPECPHCDDILRRLASSNTINSAIADKSLTVLAIYAEGKREVWKNSLNGMPDNWLVGYDLTDILDRELYDLPAMPTPYLLDNDKRVILKDPTPDRLIRRLR